MAINWTKIYNKYQGLWVALKDDQKTVIASGKTVREVMKKAKAKNFEQPILMRVPTEILPYVGNFGK
jgi:hypothetical protein